MNNSPRLVIRLIVIALFTGIAAAGCATRRSSSMVQKLEARELGSSREPVVLVCPFGTMDNDEEAIHLSLILAPLIRRDLFCVQELSVVPTEDTFAPTKAFFKNNTGLAKLGIAHGADIVAVGFLDKHEETISIELSVFDLKTGNFALKSKVAGEPSEIFGLQRELVYQFIENLAIPFSKEERKRMESSSPRKLEAALSYGEGLRQEARGQLGVALIALKNALDADKAFALPFAAEARVFRRHGAPKNATESFEKAVDRDEFFAEAWYQLNIDAASQQQMDDLAMKYCLKALEIAPRFGKAWLSLGTRHYALGDIDQAIEATNKALPLLLADPLPRHNLGVYYRDSGDPDEARKWFEEALKINPNFEYSRMELQELEGR